ncbi:hypothetical protein D4S03_05745 [bacterium]|nr:MAG: hypothetical protein D4S03_05745 [bacterium]
MRESGRGKVDFDGTLWYIIGCTVDPESTIAWPRWPGRNSPLYFFTFEKEIAMPAKKKVALPVEPGTEPVKKVVVAEPIVTEPAPPRDHYPGARSRQKGA